MKKPTLPFLPASSKINSRRKTELHRKMEKALNMETTEGKIYPRNDFLPHISCFIRDEKCGRRPRRSLTCQELLTEL